MTELEIKQVKEIAELKKLLGLDKKEKSKAFSDVDSAYLESLVSIKRNFNNDIFNNWFNNNLDISKDISFLEDILNRFKMFISQFNEDTLKVKFIGSILLRIDFLNIDLEINDFYHKKLSFKNDKIDFNGYCDFYVAKGLDTPKSPYFFIQEYKPSAGGSHPEPQLLAELISAVELNKWETIKGCYIIGSIWNFVILEKLGENKYQYYISDNFDSTKIENLKDIFRNLLYVKNEIIDMIKRDN